MAIEFDFSSARSIMLDSYKQIREAYRISRNIELPFVKDEQPDKIIVLGMGGSAIGGEFLKSYLRHSGRKTTIDISRNYKYYGKITQDTLIIVSSYSGNTAETLSSLRDVMPLTDKIVCISSGGKLMNVAEQNDYSYIQLPVGFQPRYAMYVSFFSMIGLFEHDETFFEGVETILRDRFIAYLSEKSSIVEEISSKIEDKIPLVISNEYEGYPVNLRLAAQIQENADSPAFSAVLPEMNHNMINGIVNPRGAMDNFVFVLIRNEIEPEITKRFETLKGLLIERNIRFVELRSDFPSDSFESQMDLTALSDAVSLNLARRYGADPLDIPMINLFKEKMQ